MVGMADIAHADRPALDLVGVESSRAPPQPASVASSFQPRSTASPRPVLSPSPEAG